MKSAWPALLFGGLALLLPYWFGPTLLRDVLARNDEMQNAAELQVTRASCRTFFFMVTTCRVLVQDRGGDVRTFDYAISGPVHRATITPRQSRATPLHLTTSLGLDYLGNRVVTFLVWMGILIALFIGGINYLRYHRARAAKA